MIPPPPHHPAWPDRSVVVPACNRSIHCRRPHTTKATMTCCTPTAFTVFFLTYMTLNHVSDCARSPLTSSGSKQARTGGLRRGIHKSWFALGFGVQKEPASMSLNSASSVFFLRLKCAVLIIGRCRLMELTPRTKVTIPRSFHDGRFAAADGMRQICQPLQLSRLWPMPRRGVLVWTRNGLIPSIHGVPDWLRKGLWTSHRPAGESLDPTHHACMQ